MNILRDNALSGIDLLNIYSKYNGKKGGLPNIWTYKDLDGKTLGQILGKSGKAIILFLNSENHGHWCCLYLNSKGLNFFDSYGNKPDDQYKFIPNHIAKALNGSLKRLTSMLYNAAHNVPIEYNEYELQDYSDKKVATCGRWCIVRLLYPEITVDDFQKIFTGKAIKPDDMVTYLTI